MINAQLLLCSAVHYPYIFNGEIPVAAPSTISVNTALELERKKYANAVTAAFTLTCHTMEPRKSHYLHKRITIASEE